MAQNIYIDSTSTATGDNGSETNPYLNFESLVAGDLDVGGNNVINIAGDHYLTQTFNGLKQGALNNNNVWQQWSGKPQGRLLSAVNVNLDSTYAWQSSSQEDVFYLTLANGSNPSITVQTATVDGYYRGISVKEANKKLEQLGATAPNGNAPVVGALEAGEFGYGDADSLGYNTFYFRPADGIATSHEVMISIANNYVNVALNHQTFKGLHILYGNQDAFVFRARGAIENCVIGLSEFSTLVAESSNSILTVRNCLMTQSHRSVSITAAATVDVANCVFHNSHLGLRNTSNAATITLKNTLVIGGESGAIEQTVAFTTGSLTETNNCYYTRLNDTTNKLSYVSGNWLITDATDIPPYFDTTVVIGASDNSNKYQRALPDPKVSAYSTHNWEDCDFHLTSASPCVDAGTPISGLTLDFEGVAYDTSTPVIGFYQTVIPGPDAPRAVTYISPTSVAATSAPFTLQPSQELQVFTEPTLEANEYVTIEVDDAIQGWRTMGIVVNQFDSNGFITNNKRIAQQYRLTKSATRSSTRIESN
tara:strand:+ start:2342 stop:3946 length:1605 start_codon:yes stop_codon:yes gene_type:complete